MSIASLYPSINPSLLLDFANTKQLDPRITFTRTTTATYYDGVTTAKAEENLVTYSQEFDNAAWLKNSLTVSANAAAAPDGTTTAEEITFTGSGDYLLQIVKVTAGLQYTFSFYAKAGTATGAQYRVYNVTAGSDIVAATSYYSSINSSTWTRISVTFTVPSGCSEIYVYLSRSSATSGTMFLWGAQLEQRSSVTAYTATTTQAITNYIPVLQTAAAGQARFDHNPTTGESLGLLIEEQRTNSLTYSEQFNNAAWSLYGTTVTTNAIVSPNGLQNGEKIVETTANDIHRISQGSISVTSGTAYTFTVYAKAGERTFIENRIYDGSTNAGVATFDLVNGTVSGVTGSASMTLVGNGWYRCVLTATATSSSALGLIYLKISSGVDTWTGNGYSGAFLWGAQLEAGSFATSYIPTVASTVTRNADAASMTGTNFSSWFNNGEGTIYAENSFIGVGSSAYPGVYKFSDGTISNRFGMYGRPSGAGYGAIMTTLGSLAASLEPISGSTATAINTYSRLSYGYKVNDFGATRNASTVTTDTSGNVAVGVNQLNIGLYDEYMSGTIKKLAYYPIRVTNAQLQALTV